MMEAGAVDALIFGSVARSESSEESDIDFVVESTQVAGEGLQNSWRLPHERL